jgi:hypothetical protein
MADHWVPSQQANPTLANTYPQPVVHQLYEGPVQHVAFLTVLLVVTAVYACVSFFRTLM